MMLTDLDKILPDDRQEHYLDLYNDLLETILEHYYKIQECPSLQEMILDRDFFLG